MPSPGGDDGSGVTGGSSKSGVDRPAGNALSHISSDGSGSSFGGINVAPYTSSVSALAIPAPTHLSVSNAAPGGLSPITRHSRGAFDSTPSFSSPLAYASTLPTEQAEDLELEPSLPEAEVEAEAEAEGEGETEADEIVHSRRRVSEGRNLSVAASSPPSSYRAPFTPTPLGARRKTSSSQDEDDTEELMLEPSSPSASAMRKERTTSARAKLLAWGSGQEVEEAIPRQAGLSERSIAGHARRKSMAPPSSALMGPPLMIPRRTGMGRGRTDADAGGLRSQAAFRISSGTTEDSHRSVSTSSTSSAEGNTSPSISWQPPPNFDSLHSTAKANLAGENTAISKRARASTTQGTLTNAHRRAKSLGGALLGEAASPIGGPDGVDPSLVAAIRAGDSSIPGAPVSLEVSLSRMSLGHDGRQGEPSLSPTSRIASLPSTPSGSVRMPTPRKPSDQLSNMAPDARALASSYPKLQIPGSSVKESGSLSPTLTRQSDQHTRTRVRSQTLLPASPEVDVHRSGSFRSSSNMRSSFGASSNTPQASFNRANAPLGDAIRLQKMPASIRLAGDLYSRGEPSIRSNASPGQSSIGSSPLTGHGLGIGVPAPPQTPSVTRSTSPLTMGGVTRSSSISSSGRSSPALPRMLDVPASSQHRHGTFDPSPLTVAIPSFQPQEVNVDTLSAGPALQQREEMTGASASLRPSPSAGWPLSTDQLSSSLSQSHSAFAPLLAMPSPRSRKGPEGAANRSKMRASVGAAFAEMPDLDALGGTYDPEGLSLAQILTQESSPADASQRPAPWISSSQEVRRGNSNSTLKAALTQREREATVTHNLDAARPDSDIMRTNRRLSVAPTPQGIDEYARIIVQSRNAKMLKWRSKPRHRQQLASVSQEKVPRQSLLKSASDGGGERTSTESVTREVATPNVSPAASLNEGDATMSDAIGRREIEWVDWLDDYRRLKEAKLRAEREEKEARRRQEEEAEVSMELEAISSINNRKESPVDQSSSPSGSPTTTTGKLDSPSPSRAMQSLSASLGVADGRRGQKPRRPSEMPRFGSRQDLSAERRSSSNNLLLMSGLYPEGESPTIDRRSSLYIDHKSRTLSLSPINSRIASNASQQSNTSSGTVSGRKKKMLGGKIEAWWSAVKSGFGGVTSTPPSPFLFNQLTPAGSSLTRGDQPAATSRLKREKSPGELDSTFANYHRFGGPHNRSNTVHLNPRQPSEAKSVHTLRAASSAQDLRGDDSSDPVPANSDGPSMTSERSSTGTAHATAPMSTSPTRQFNSTVVVGAAMSNKLSRSSSTKATRKNMQLSLSLEPRATTAEAESTEKLMVKSIPRNDQPLTQVEPAKSSPKKAVEDVVSTPLRTASSTLSDAWRPDDAARGKSASGRGSSTSSLSRGRSSQRRLGGAEEEPVKGITVNSIREHIHNRLAASKESCDRELRKVILSINASVEETIQDRQREADEEQDEERSGGAAQDANADDDGDDAHSGVFDQDTDLESPLGNLTLGDVDPLLRVQPSAPASVSYQNRKSGWTDPDETPQPETVEGPMEPTPRRATQIAARVSGEASSTTPEYSLPAPPRRGPSSAPLALSRSASRSAALARDHSTDGLTPGSRSTSRSHSPMPGSALFTSSATASPRISPARRIRPLPTREDAPLDSYLTALQDLVTIAMDVVDISINTLTARPGACSEFIAKVQDTGRLWDENPQWGGREWYVKLLLAVAGLSRVVEWWEAEKGFWNFEDDLQGQGSQGDTEPIRFIFGNAAQSMAEGADYGDYQQSANAVARHAVSASPSRARHHVVQQIIQTPSQQSSATNSPALEPWDKSAVSEGSRSRMASMSKDGQQQPSVPSDAERPSSPRMDEGTVEGVTPILPKEESLNVLMELSLDGERFLYVSPAWRKIIGSDPSEILDTPISHILAPGDSSNFAQATEQLQANDSHTVEVAFRLQVMAPADAAQDREGMTYYQEMEGKGMLMHDRQSATASHTMWVFKPIAAPETEVDLAPGPQRPVPGAGEPSVMAEGAGLAQDRMLLSTEPLLCRICERDIPTWFFEKHSEICNEIHRLEMEISEYNETLAELRRVTWALLQALEDAERTENVEYRNIVLSTPPASIGPPSALEVANRSISPHHPNPAAIRKLHLRALYSLMDILRVAGTISTPAVKDDTLTDPIEKQRLLTPESEDKIMQVRNWKRVACDDAALDLLTSDVDTAMRSKLSAVNRNLNTIVYVETVRMEWEGRVEAALAQTQVQNESEGSSEQEDANEEMPAEGQEIAAPSADPPASSSEMREAHPAASPMREEEDMDNATAAVLLERYEPDMVRSTSTTLSARRDIASAREEDIPGMDGDMGGSLMDSSPIPIPTARPTPSRTPRHRPMMRDPSSASSVAIESVASPPGALLLDTFGPHSRRESLLTNERRTPPLSPRYSPAEYTSQRIKDRRISITQRGGSGGGLHSPLLMTNTPLSPRIPPSAPSSRPTASSIKDFDIIKPISKGAFGSVFLAKKRTTGDYYAIKVLKKSDMIAKNQITNVKAERMILMTQTQSPFVVKLFFTFQNAEYLYLVMEYLPGGDCASLCKALGGLPEAWAKQYVAEVVNGLEMLHEKGVVHRDMKPDNLLIDQKGHLKLTDFGLSKIGLLGRQNRQQMSSTTSRSNAGTSGVAVPTSEGYAKRDSAGSVPPVGAGQKTGSGTHFSSSPVQVKGTMGSAAGPSRLPETPLSTNIAQSQTFYIGISSNTRDRIMSASTDASDSSGSDSPMVRAMAKPVPVVSTAPLLDSPSQSFATHMLGESLSSSAAVQSSGGSNAQLKKFVGTPDYLAPESILGLGMDDAAVDWWALGVILYEFLYGMPPFHADTPEKVFDNILSRHIDWEEDEDLQISIHARDLMEKLMCTDRKHRLGAGENGAADIKAHPFFEGIDWNELTKVKGPFVPKITDAESTDYFDLRGAVFQEFNQDQVGGQQRRDQQEAQKDGQSTIGLNQEFAKALEGKRVMEPSRPPSRYRMRLDRNRTKDTSQGGTDDFGSFSYKNLPVLKQANDEVIKKMRGDQLSSMGSAMMEQSHHNRHRSISGKVSTPGHRNSIFLPGIGPPSPSTSVSSQSSAPSKSTAPTSPSGAPFLANNGAQLPSLHQNLTQQSQRHRRRPSELSSVGGGALATAGSPVGVGSVGAGTSMMERKRSQLTESDNAPRRSSMPTRLRGDFTIMPSSASSTTADSGMMAKMVAVDTEATSTEGQAVSSDVITCLVAEDNPISLRMLENILLKLGCGVESVRNGAEALRLAMAETKYAVLFIDVTLPIVNGQDVARMIKSTRNVNSVTPIIALASFESASLDVTGSVFDAVLAKPIEKADVCNILPRFGFRPLVVTTRSGSGGNSARRLTVAGLERTNEEPILAVKQLEPQRVG